MVPTMPHVSHSKQGTDLSKYSNKKEKVQKGGVQSKAMEKIAESNRKTLHRSSIHYNLRGSDSKVTDKTTQQMPFDGYSMAEFKALRNRSHSLVVLHQIYSMHISKENDILREEAKLVDIDIGKKNLQTLLEMKKQNELDQSKKRHKVSHVCKKIMETEKFVSKFRQHHAHRRGSIPTATSSLLRQGRTYHETKEMDNTFRRRSHSFSPHRRPDSPDITLPRVMPLSLKKGRGHKFNSVDSSSSIFSINDNISDAVSHSKRRVMKRLVHAK